MRNFHLPLLNNLVRMCVYIFAYQAAYNCQRSLVAAVCGNYASGNIKFVTTIAVADDVAICC